METYNTTALLAEAHEEVQVMEHNYSTFEVFEKFLAGEENELSAFIAQADDAESFDGALAASDVFQIGGLNPGAEDAEYTHMMYRAWEIWAMSGNVIILINVLQRHAQENDMIELLNF